MVPIGSDQFRLVRIDSGWFGWARGGWVRVALQLHKYIHGGGRGGWVPVGSDGSDKVGFIRIIGIAVGSYAP